MKTLKEFKEERRQYFNRKLWSFQINKLKTMKNNNVTQTEVRENELQSLKNAIDNLNLKGYEILNSHTRKYQYCLVDNKGTYLTGFWNYEQLNHFILGYGKAYQKWKPGLKAELTEQTEVKHTPLPWKISGVGESFFFVLLDYCRITILSENH